jgi:cytoskeletal protein CcmA (bactofilin family)
MFNRDAMFGKKLDRTSVDPRAGVNTTPAPGGLTQNRNVTESAVPEPVPQPATVKPPAAPEEGKGSKLIVGPDIKLKGVEITDCDTLVVEGRVEAAMDSRVIRIAESGVFSGTAGIDVADIRGRFEGELTARKQLIIHATGRVSGRIRYGRISIEEGGEIAGDVGKLDAPAKSEAAGNTPRQDKIPVDIMTAYDPFERKGKPAQPARN